MSTITDAQRNALVANLKWFFEYGDLFGYEQVRPFVLRRRATFEADFDKHLAINGYDCVASIVNAFYITGLKDPSGQNFTGNGNTDTMLEYLAQESDPAKAHLGALVLFGADLPLSEQHVCAIVGDPLTDNPMLFSHGQPGVKWLTLAEEQTAHKGSTVFLSIVPLG